MLLLFLILSLTVSSFGNLVAEEDENHYNNLVYNDPRYQGCSHCLCRPYPNCTRIVCWDDDVDILA